MHLRLFALIALLGLGATRSHADSDAVASSLPLRHTSVSAEISGFISRVTVTQTFTNLNTTPIEAVYTYPLPQNAAVSGFKMIIADRVITGVVKKREEARQLYEDAKREGKATALLDQERPNIFSQRIANIMPGSEIQVEITYDEVLEYAKGSYEFMFPMTIGPRFIPSAGKVPDADRITPPMLKPGEANPHTIDLTLTLQPGLPVRNLASPTHEIIITTNASSYTVALDVSDRIPNKDFVFRYTSAGQDVEYAWLTHKQGDQGYFMLMFQPPETAAPEKVTPKEMVFVVDCSGSMNGEPIALAKKAMRHALKNLNPDDTFQIIRFSESASPFARQPLPASEANVRQGLSYINGLNGEGGTMMIEGIKAALDYPHEDNRLRIVCFMTDGYIGNEAEILAAIQERLGDQTRLFSFGVGSSVNRYLLDAMADAGRGEVQYITLGEKPCEQVEKFYARVRNPVLTHVQVDWATLEASDFAPARMKDLFTGTPLMLLGRYRTAGSATVQIRGKVHGESVSHPLPVEFPATDSANGVLEQLWARERIKELSTELYKDENSTVAGRITALALEHQLLSDYTSFVAVDQKVVNEGGVLKTVDVPLEMPEGVSHESIFGKDQNLMVMSHGGMMPQSAALPAKRARLASTISGLVCAPISLMTRETSDRAVEPETAAPPTADVDITYKPEDDDQPGQTLTINREGDVWLERPAADGKPGSRIYLTRLDETARRELQSRAAQALSKVVQHVRHARPGTLIVKQYDAGGRVAREIQVQLNGQADPQDAWNKLIAFLEELLAQAA